MAIGASATNTSAFEISVAPDFVCGTPINLVLSAAHNGGTNEIPILLNSGSGVGTAARFDATDTPVPIDPFFGGSSSVTVTGIASSVPR